MASNSVGVKSYTESKTLLQYEGKVELTGEQESSFSSAGSKKKPLPPKSTDETPYIAFISRLSKEKGVILHMYKEEEYTYKENDILFTRRCILGVWTAGATGAIWWGRRLFLYYSRMTCFYLFFRP